jgi:signal transduction histidine kinase
VGRIDAEVFPPERAREMTELDARCLHNSIVVEREVEVTDDEGQTRHLLCVRYPLADTTYAAQRMSGIGSIYLDITRQKRIEAELRTARSALVTRAAALGATNDQLREIDRMKTEFISSVSHELRTPLTSIRGYLEMLRDGEHALPEEMVQRFLAIIDRNSEHLLSLIEDLLLLSRMDAGQYTARDREISVDGIVRSAVSMLQPAVQQALLTVSVRVDDELPAVAGDPGQLERVVINLLSNAVKFSAPGGQIAIRAKRARGGVAISIKDDGMGIAPEEQHQLFTRFFRTAAARERGIPGTGLGLAVVRGIVKGHGGTVEVGSAPGRGTTMTVRLPAAKQQ